MKTLVDNFQTKQKSPKNEVIKEIMRGSQVPDIVKWVKKTFEVSKHHVHVLTISPRRTSVPSGFKLNGVSPVDVDNAEALFLLDLEYVATVRYPDGSYGDETLEFKWPVKVVFAGNQVLLKIITIEKKLTAHLESEMDFVAAKRNLDEKVILGYAGSALQNLNISQTDLNKGTKALWNTDEVDGTAGEWVTSTSTAIHKMHAKCYLKRHKPTEFAEAMKSPLRKTLFEVMEGVAGLASPFIVDPGIGSIVFPTYGDDPAHACHVVGKILQNN